MPLAELTSAKRHAEARQWQLPHSKGDDQFLVFVDYMQSSWAYAVRCAPPLESKVILLGRERPEIIAESFAEFVDLYVVDSPRMYEGTPIDVP